MFQFPALAHPSDVTDCSVGLPHSEISGSQVICTSPELVAAYHVLLRLREPRHPPVALSYFFRSYNFDLSCSKCTCFFCCVSLLPLPSDRSERTGSRKTRLIYFTSCPFLYIQNSEESGRNVQVELFPQYVKDRRDSRPSQEPSLLCGEYRNRTDDLLHAMQAL